jgi:hypothetical protein
MKDRESLLPVKKHATHSIQPFNRWAGGEGASRDWNVKGLNAER